MWTNAVVNKDALSVLCCSTIIPHWPALPLLQPQLDAALLLLLHVVPFCTTSTHVALCHQENRHLRDKSVDKHAEN